MTADGPLLGVPIAWLATGVVVSVLIVLGLVPAVLARRQGRNFALWWIYGAVLLPVALVHVLLLTRDAEASSSRGPAPGAQMACPACGESIPANARECRYCGQDLVIPVDRETRKGKEGEAPAEWDEGFASLVSRGAGEQPPPYAEPPRQGGLLVAATAAAFVAVIAAGAWATHGLLWDVPDRGGSGPGQQASVLSLPEMEPAAGARSGEDDASGPPDASVPGASGGAGADAPADMRDTGARADGPADGTELAPVPEKSLPAAGSKSALPEPPSDGVPPGKPAELASSGPADSDLREEDSPAVTGGGEANGAEPGPPLPKVKPAVPPEPPRVPPEPDRRAAASAETVAPPSPPARQKPPDEITAVGDLVQWVQNELSNRGYYKGKVDGRAGKTTRAAIRAFQQNNSLTATGRIDAALIAKLRRTSSAAEFIRGLSQD